MYKDWNAFDHQLRSLAKAILQTPESFHPSLLKLVEKQPDNSPQASSDGKMIMNAALSKGKTLRLI